MQTTQLNPEQQRAVDHIEGPLLVLAGAGSGKTRIVTHRIAHLLEIGVPSHEILGLTFTNKAADEMRHRVLHLTHQSVLTCTFHSLCARILRESIGVIGYTRDFTIYDEEDSEKALKQCFLLANLKEEKAQVKKIRAQISQAKNSLLGPDEIEEEEPDFKQLYSLYQQKLKEYNALDFDDLLFLTVKLFKSSPEILEIYQQRWRFILIDEYQDTNAAQYTITKLLAEKHHNVFAVGDPDQSIYSWRGADIQNILNFEKDFPGAEVIPLEQNYRSRSNILEAANALIRHNASRYEKNLWSDRGPGEKIACHIAEDDHREADFVVKQLYKLHRERGVPLRDCAIFYRTNFQSRIFEDHLLRERVPYVIVGGVSFYQRREIKDVLSLMRMVLSGTDNLSFLRTINLPKRGLGEATLERLQELAAERGESLFDTCTAIVEERASFKLSQKQAEGLKNYTHTIATLREMLKQNCTLHEVISEAMARSRYLEYLKEDPESYEERRGNLEELINKAREWEQEVDSPTLALFLEELTLKSNPEKDDGLQDQVRMMTLHNGKGLEFTAVFLVGLEEELLPHINSLHEPEAVEEERRLCYVGMTRAKEFLFLSASAYRYLFGMPRFMRPSRFLKEIPEEYLHKSRSNGVSGSWNETETLEGFSSSTFTEGDIVAHKDFGMGIVQKSYNTSLGLTYDVCFPKLNAVRSLVAKFAKLRKLEE